MPSPFQWAAEEGLEGTEEKETRWGQTPTEGEEERWAGRGLLEARWDGKEEMNPLGSSQGP